MKRPMAWRFPQSAQLARRLRRGCQGLRAALLVALAASSGATPAAAQVTDPFAQPSQSSGGQGTGFGAPSGIGSDAASGSSAQPGVIAPAGASTSGDQTAGAQAGFSPVVLPPSSTLSQGDFNDQIKGRSGQANPTPPAPASARPPPPLSEFEQYVAQRAGHPLPRFGSSLLLQGAQAFATSPTATVPPDYHLNPGDELLIGITGSVEADLRLVIDSEGRVFLPRIGAVNVAGLRYGDLADALTRRLSTQYKKAEVSVVIGHLHGVTVYVTGYAVTPGAYTVSSLATMVDAVLAGGGPSSGGSFRDIQLRRGGRLVATLDLYDLLLNGDQSHDATLQNGDVLNIGPVGPELAVIGSVNAEAIYEARPGETLGDILRYAGGLNSLADDSRILVAGLSDLDTAGARQLTLAAAKSLPANRGDIVRVLSLASIARPLERQAILATIEGEVDHPGRYFLPPGSTMGDLLAKAGGLTGGAFVYGAELRRESIQKQQQVSFDRAIFDLQVSVSAAPLSSLAFITSGQGAAVAARTQAALALIEKLKTQKPDGRLVLALTPSATALPGDLPLENNDRVLVPPRPRTVGVFGAVYQTGSFLYTPGSRLGAYVKLAGGTKPIADRGDIFVVRANGSVMSMRQVHDFANQPALPGDVLYVPIKTNGGVFEKVLAVAAVIYQFGVGALTLRALGL